MLIRPKGKKTTSGKRDANSASGSALDAADSILTLCAEYSEYALCHGYDAVSGRLHQVYRNIMQLLHMIASLLQLAVNDSCVFMHSITLRSGGRTVEQCWETSGVQALGRDLTGMSETPVGSYPASAEISDSSAMQEHTETTDKVSIVSTVGTARKVDPLNFHDIFALLFCEMARRHSGDAKHGTSRASNQHCSLTGTSDVGEGAAHGLPATETTLLSHPSSTAISEAEPSDRSRGSSLLPRGDIDLESLANCYITYAVEKAYGYSATVSLQFITKSNFHFMMDLIQELDSCATTTYGGEAAAMPTGRGLRRYYSFLASYSDDSVE